MLCSFRTGVLAKACQLRRWPTPVLTAPAEAVAGSSQEYHPNVSYGIRMRQFCIGAHEKGAKVWTAVPVSCQNSGEFWKVQGVKHESLQPLTSKM